MRASSILNLCNGDVIYHHAISITTLLASSRSTCDAITPDLTQSQSITRPRVAWLCATVCPIIGAGSVRKISTLGVAEKMLGQRGAITSAITFSVRMDDRAKISRNGRKMYNSRNIKLTLHLRETRLLQTQLSNASELVL